MTAKNTSVMLLKNVPFNSDYSNTLATFSTSEQFEYFSTKFDIVLQQSHLSYIRPNKGSLQINTPITSDLANVNYMIFINKAHENRYFYAFVNEINYINDLTTEIVYELDYMQSYLPFAKLNKCFIERQHTKSDNLYEHLVTENLDTGDTIAVENIDINLKLAVVVATVNQVDFDVPADVLGVGDGAFSRYSADETYNAETMVVSPLKYYRSDISGDNASILVDLNAGWFKIVNELGKGVDGDNKAVACYIAPYGSKTIPLLPKQTYHGYANAKNKKMFTFPFTYLRLENYEGRTQNLKYENFNNAGANSIFNLKVLNSILNKGESICFPLNYNGIENNIEVGLNKTKFLNLGVKDDTFYNFLNRDLPSALIQTGSNLAVGALTGGSSLKNAVVGGATSLGSSFVSAMNRPDEVRGLGDSNYLQRALGVDNKFRLSIMQMKPEYAKNIDEYFTRYGYAQNTIAIPNITARPYFTYVKTANSCVGGAIPNKAKNTINTAFNNGVTFWKPNAKPCDFSQDNSV